MEVMPFFNRGSELSFISLSIPAFTCWQLLSPCSDVIINPQSKGHGLSVYERLFGWNTEDDR